METNNPGKYDEQCTIVRHDTQAMAVALIIVGGSKGHGASVQAAPEVAHIIPNMLKQAAAMMERDLVAPDGVSIMADTIKNSDRFEFMMKMIDEKSPEFAAMEEASDRIGEEIGDDAPLTRENMIRCIDMAMEIVAAKG